MPAGAQHTTERACTTVVSRAYALKRPLPVINLLSSKRENLKY